jgi:hypothetical protein
MRHRVIEPVKKGVLTEAILSDGPEKVLSNNLRLTYNCLVKGEHEKQIGVHYKTISSSDKNNCRLYVLVDAL